MTVEEITLRLVDKVREQQDLQGRNITFDNLYTSIPLAEKLLDRKITIVGKMRHNRKGLPKEIKSMEGERTKQLHSLLGKERAKTYTHHVCGFYQVQGFEKYHCACFYAPPAWSDKR